MPWRALAPQIPRARRILCRQFGRPKQTAGRSSGAKDLSYGIAAVRSSLRTTTNTRWCRNDHPVCGSAARDSERLGQRLLQYVADHPSNQLTIRLHPTASESDPVALQKELDRWCQKAFARLSPATSPLTDDLANASVASQSLPWCYMSRSCGAMLPSAAAQGFCRPRCVLCPASPSPQCARLQSSQRPLTISGTTGPVRQQRYSSENLQPIRTDVGRSRLPAIVARLPRGDCASPGTRTASPGCRILSLGSHSPPRVLAIGNDTCWGCERGWPY